MKTTKQYGFSLALLITAIVAVGVAGFIAWRLLTANPQPASQPNNTISTEQQADANAGYIVIKEWGVRFKPVEGLDGVLYYKVPSAGDDFFAFTTESLTQADKNCGPDSGSIVLAGLARSQEPSGSGQRFGPFGGYYYYARASSAACSSRPNELEGTAKGLLLRSFESLEASK